MGVGRKKEGGAALRLRRSLEKQGLDCCPKKYAGSLNAEAQAASDKMIAGMRILITLSLCAGSLLSLAAAERVSTPIDNDSVRVLDVTVQPHEKTRKHEHKVNRVMVYLDAGQQHFDWDNAKSTDLKWKAGEPLWSPAAGMHVAELTSPKPVRIIEVELKKPGAGKSPSAPEKDPLKLAPKNYKVAFENDQVRVSRVHFGPGESVPMHEHATNRVTVLLADQDFRITTSDGQVQTPKRKYGEVTWGTPVTHREENLSDKPFDLIMIDLKY